MGDTKQATGIVGRIAPSPSGLMHLGNAFSALLAWAWTRQRNGTFLVRLEDLDERCKDHRYTEALLDDLRWLGIDWDEKPFVQSEHIDSYESALRQIEKNAEVYPCFCTRADLHAASAPHASDGTPVYAGTCYAMSDTQRRRRSLARKPALRLHVNDEEIAFIDGAAGTYRQNLARECGDFVLRRSDDVFAYQLVCVVDDSESGVTDVVRARDLLLSTPRQLLLYRLLGKPAPRFFHHPLLLAPDGRRLSKRDKDCTIAALRDTGLKPEQVIGYIAALIGLVGYGEGLSAIEFSRCFDWASLPAKDIIVDYSKLP